MGTGNTDIDMYDKVCKDRFKSIEDKVDAGFADLSKKIFIGNGKKSIMTLIEENAVSSKDNRLKLGRHLDAEHAEAVAQRRAEDALPPDTTKKFGLGKSGATFENFGVGEILVLIFAFVSAICLILIVLNKYGVLGAVEAAG